MPPPPLLRVGAAGVLGGGATWLAEDDVTVEAVLTLAAPGTADGDQGLRWIK